MGEEDLQMSSQRPYLLRALYEWIADNGMTPHVLVDAARPGVRVPAHAVKDGRIVLNIAERAVAKLELGNEALRFTARFAGVSQVVNVPLDAVVAIYARETGQGMALPEAPRAGSGGATDGAMHTQPGPDAGDDAGSDGDATTDPAAPDRPDQPPRRGSHLRIVK